MPLATQRPPQAARSTRRRVVTVIAWIIALGALFASTLWLLAGWFYTLDLLANLGAQTLLVMLVPAIAVALTRRRGPTLVVIAACVFQAVPLVRHRAAYWPRSIALEAPPGPGVVRLLHYNDSSLSKKEAVYDLIRRTKADIVSILCPPVSMQSDVIYQHGLEDQYAGKLTRRWQVAPDGVNTEVSAGFVVSRWPLSPIDCSFVGTKASRFMAGVVERPTAEGGRFVFIAVHPRSPRTPERWIEGNQTVHALALLSATMQERGLPVVVLTDLNATPSGWRSRAACGGGNLLRAKPLLVLDGTYPDVVPLNIRTRKSTGVRAAWPASIAIDDALVSPGVEVDGWAVLPRLQSEHRPVVVDLAIPAATASVPNPDGR